MDCRAGLMETMLSPMLVLLSWVYVVIYVLNIINEKY